MFYEDILRKLNQQKIKFVVVGGIAFNLLGGSRATQDLDILIMMDNENISRLINLLLENGYKPRQQVDPYDFTNREIREDWIKNKNMKAFNFYKDYQSFEEIDIIIDSPVDFKEALTNATIFKIDDIQIPVISIDNLITMKEADGREIDKFDINELKIIKKIKNAEK